MTTHTRIDIDTFEALQVEAHHRSISVVDLLAELWRAWQQGGAQAIYQSLGPPARIAKPLTGHRLHRAGNRSQVHH